MFSYNRALNCGAELINYAHLRSIIIAPCSSNSCLDIHICWNDPKLDNIDPPIHALNFLSAGICAMTLTLTFGGAISGTNFWMRSTNPGMSVLPPATTILLYSSFLISRSDRTIASATMRCTPEKLANSATVVNICSGIFFFSLSSSTFVPSGSSYEFVLVSVLENGERVLRFHGRVGRKS